MDSEGAEVQKAADALRNCILGEGLLEPDKMFGCSLDQIAELETAFGVQLPTSYKAFLFLLGRTRRIFGRSGMTYPGVIENRCVAEELLEEVGASFRLSPHHWVFLEHEGYLFEFFDCAEGQNPKVFLFRDDMVEPVKHRDSFEDTVLAYLRDLKRLETRTITLC